MSAGLYWFSRTAAATLLALTALAAQAETLPLYLLATGVPTSTLSATPSATGALANYDPARDAVEGLLIVRGGTAGTSDATKYQSWLSGTAGLTLSGSLQLNMWSSSLNFQTATRGVVIAFLRDCNSSGASCSTLYTARLDLSSWNIGVAGWVQRTIDFGAVSATIAAGRTLELKLVVDNDSATNMWFAYATTTYSSALSTYTPRIGCATFGTTAGTPLYGAKILTVENGTTVFDGTTTRAVTSGVIGKSVDASTGTRYDPNPTPNLPSLLPASFPVNTATADVTTVAATTLAPGSYRTVTVNAAGPLTFSAGTFYINKLEVMNNASIVLGAGTYFIREFRINNFTTATLSGREVRLNIGGPATIGDDATWNLNGSPRRLQIFMYPGINLVVAKRFRAAVVIYSPDIANIINIDDEAQITGAVIGQEVKLQQNSAISSTAAMRSSIAAINTCTVVTVDHYELSVPSTALACLASTVTVTACADTSSPCTTVDNTVFGETATLAASDGTLGSTSVTFNGSGVATTTLSWPAASNGGTTSVTLSGEQAVASNPRKCCPNGTACSVANSCSTTYSTAGFIVAASAGGAAATVPAQTAGTASAGYFLRAVQTGTTTKACEAAITGTSNVNWSTTCNNPTTCSAGNLMTVTGDSAVAVAGNANGSTASSTAVPMTFDANGNAPFSFNYADVGQVTLNASRAASGSLLTALSGSSNAFVVRPGGFAISNIKQTAAPQLVNPAAGSAAGSKFVKAGEAFTATVTAQTSGGVTTPNYGRETSPEGVLLTRTLVLPAAGSTGTLSNATIAGGSFSSGAATVTNLAFSEVGIITLTPSVGDGSYLGAGNTTGTATGNIGRFFPAQFGLSAGSVTHRSALSCAPASAFSYLGENFRLGLTLTAQNAAGATTTNYTGSFAMLDPTSASWNLAGRDATTVFTVASTRLSLGSATGSFSNGVASGVTLTANAARATTPDGPFSAAFGVAPVDSDGVSLAAFDMASASGGGNDRTQVATVPLRFGRLRVGSAAGAADRALALPVAAQSWTGSAFDTNTLDSCTTVATTAMSFGNLRGTLTTADTAASAAITLASGAGSLRLAAPGGGRSGTYDVALSLGSAATDASCLQSWTPGLGDAASAGANLAYLRGNFCASSYSNDPAARATFGRQRGMDSLVYRRENY